MPILAQKSLCCGAKFAMTFSDASPEVKLVAVLLFAVAIASPVLWLRARRRGAGPRSLAFLAGWRLAAPLLAVAAGGYVLMNFFVALYSYPPVPANLAYGPGLAEVSMLLFAGFLAGGVASLCHADLTRRLPA